MSDGNTGRCANLEDKLPERKCTRVITTEGREVVGPGYSTCKITTKKDMVDIKPHGKQEADATVKQAGVEVNGVKPDLRDRATRDPGDMDNPDIVRGLGRWVAGLHTSKKGVPTPWWCPSGLTKT
jgi:hypothetical protein